MNAIEIVNKLKGHKGQHIALEWERDAKTKKAFAGIIRKHVKAYVRTGINYANLSSVKAGIEAGERDEVQSLPWGQWRDGMANYVIDHNGKEYVRLYPAVFDNLKNKMETQWTLNGKPTNFDVIKADLLASEHPKDEERTCFNINAADVLNVG